MSDHFATADLCDDHSLVVEVYDPVFRDFGRIPAFLGSINPVRFAGVLFKPGDWLHSDGDGVVVAPQAVHLGPPAS